MDLRKSINELPVEDVGHLMHFILYAAVEGMEGYGWPSDYYDTEYNRRVEEYVRGCVETAARTLASIFAESKYDSANEGIPIGETVAIIEPHLHNAMELLTRNEDHMFEEAETHCQEAARAFLDAICKSVGLRKGILDYFNKSRPKNSFRVEIEVESVATVVVQAASREDASRIAKNWINEGNAGVIGAESHVPRRRGGSTIISGYLDNTVAKRARKVTDAE